MSKPLTYLLFICAIIQTQAQEKRVIISGRIISDAKSKDNIHILNISSRKGTISNSQGKFVIPAKENDSLVISGIQFYKKEILITNKIIADRKIHIELFQKINELDEVEIRTLILSGNLITDAKNVKDSISKVNPMALDFSMIDFSKPVINEVDRTKPPDATNLTNPNIPVGGNVLGLLSFVLDPLMSEISKIGQRKRRLNNEKYLYEKKTIETPNNIVDELGESFFIETLKIPRANIDAFLEHCKSKRITDLYIKGRKIEVIDILIEESKNYKK